jgi:hypothetical protein
MSVPQRSDAAPVQPPSLPLANAPKIRALHPGQGAGLVLHVLSGAQRGAQARIAQQRVLVGNLLGECDVVIDTGNSSPSLACLIRASQDGWSVLAIAGPLWVGLQRVAPEQAVTITQGEVITLGPAAFCIGDPRRIDFSRVAIPNHLDASSEKKRNNAASQDRAMIPKYVRAWREFLSAAWRKKSRPISPASRGYFALTACLLIATAFATLAIFLFTTARPSPAPTPKISAEHHRTAIHELHTELAHRLALLSPQDHAQLQHTAQGHFALSQHQHQFKTLDPRIRRAFQELPALQAITLQLRPSADAASSTSTITSGGDAVLRYSRSPSAPSGVEVQGLDTLAFLQPPPDVHELRLGTLPSIVLADGERYFVGSALPGGAVLRSIEPHQLRVQIGTQLQRIGLGRELGVLQRAQPETPE